MAASEKLYSIKLNESEVPGAKFRCSDVTEHSICELKRWLECRGLPVGGKKPDLVKRCLECISSGKTDVVISVDGGKWYEHKVSEVLTTVRNTNNTSDNIPLLPTTGWQKFPSKAIPKGFCYGRIYEHIITTARVSNYDCGSNSDSDDKLTDFNTSKPMLKGRQYFVSGHVKTLQDHASKGAYYHLKSTVMASYTQQRIYHVSLTLEVPSGKVADASCDCKASSMGRCSHIAALMFALEDYTLQFGYDPCAATSKLCKWNLGRKSKRDPKPCYEAKYAKKLKPDRIISHDSRPSSTRTKEQCLEFANTFIATLPNTGSENMFSQVLEIEYENYDVDYPSLAAMTQCAISQMTEAANSLKSPMEVAGTHGQANTDTWHNSRYLRVTASNAKEAATTHTQRGKYHLLKRTLWGKKLPDLKGLKYGRENEEKAFEQYAKASPASLQVKQCGFWINPHYPELGCSPDGLIYKGDELVGVLEIKCPLVLQDTSPDSIEDLKPRQKYGLCYTLENAVPRLKRAHKYFYQVQMQIAILEVEYCDFVIWTPKGMTVERIHADTEFWNDLKPKLINFHHNCLVPEYLEMRIPRRLMPVDLVPSA